jgi:hypothetical protein
VLDYHHQNRNAEIIGPAQYAYFIIELIVLMPFDCALQQFCDSRRREGLANFITYFQWFARTMPRRGQLARRLLHVV